MSHIASRTEYLIPTLALLWHSKLTENWPHWWALVQFIDKFAAAYFSLDHPVGAVWCRANEHGAQMRSIQFPHRINLATEHHYETGCRPTQPAVSIALSVVYVHANGNSPTPRKLQQNERKNNNWNQSINQSVSQSISRGLTFRVASVTEPTASSTQVLTRERSSEQKRFNWCRTNGRKDGHIHRLKFSGFHAPAEKNNFKSIICMRR